MSLIKANNFTNANNDGPPAFPFGVNIQNGIGNFFSIQGLGGFTALNTETPIDWDNSTVTADPNNYFNYNTSTKVLTPVAGIYVCSFGCSLDGNNGVVLVTLSDAYLRIYQNAVLVQDHNSGTAGVGAELIRLAVGAVMYLDGTQPLGFVAKALGTAGSGSQVYAQGVARLQLAKVG